jgi:hypothetical protein
VNKLNLLPPAPSLLKEKNILESIDKSKNLWYNNIRKGQGQSKKPERKIL